MQKTLSDSKTQTLCLLLIAGVALTTALIYTKSILVPFVFSIFLYSASLPFVGFWQNKAKLPRGFAVFVTVLISFLSVALLGYLLGASIEDFSKSAVAYKSRLIEFVDFASIFVAKFGYSFESASLQTELEKLPLLDITKKFTGGAVSVVGNLSLVLIFFLFLILGEHRPKKSAFVKETQERISKYITTKFILSAATGFITWLILFIFGAELAFMFGLLTLLLNFIPNIGSLIAVALPLPVLLLQFGLGWQLFVIVGLCGVIQMVIGNILEPKLMGDSMGLHPITILIFLMFWGLVWGIPGMFLAVPITAILKIVLERIEPTRKVAQLLAGN